MSPATVPLRDVRWRCRGVYLRGLVGFVVAMPLAIWLGFDGYISLGALLAALAGVSAGVAIGAELVDSRVRDRVNGPTVRLATRRMK